MSVRRRSILFLTVTCVVAAASLLDSRPADAFATAGPVNAAAPGAAATPASLVVGTAPAANDSRPCGASAEDMDMQRVIGCASLDKVVSLDITARRGLGFNSDATYERCTGI